MPCVAATTPPVAFVFKSAEAMPEMVRLEVEAVPLYMVPETPKAVDDAVASVTLPLNVLVPEKVLLVVVPNAIESALPENVSGYVRVAAPATPDAFVARSEFWRLEMVRLEVDAVPLYMVVAESAVDDAYGRIDALLPVAVKDDAVGVEVAETTPLAFVARIPFCIPAMVRLVVDAVVAKKVPETVAAVDDAKVMVPLVAVRVAKVCVPAQVLEVVVPYAVEKTPVPLLYWSG